MLSFGLCQELPHLQTIKLSFVFHFNNFLSFHLLKFYSMLSFVYYFNHLYIHNFKSLHFLKTWKMNFFFLFLQLRQTFQQKNFERTFPKLNFLHLLNSNMIKKKHTQNILNIQTTQTFAANYQKKSRLK